MIAINNLAPPQQLGLVVSTAQAVASAIRTLGPAAGGALFSLAMAQEAAGAWRLEAVYALMAALAALTSVLSMRIPVACEQPPVGLPAREPARTPAAKAQGRQPL